MIKKDIDFDLKQALLSGDKSLASVLRTIKGAILNLEIELGVRDPGLDDDKIIALLQKESKKRKDAIEIYKKAGDEERATKEKYEIEVIAKYLPEMMTTEEIETVVDKVIAGMGEKPTMKQMGAIIGAVKSECGNLADGGTISVIVKSKIS